ncbi:hypothetical protein GCM10027067_16560 [Pseudactinotalea suaedae]
MGPDTAARRVTEVEYFVVRAVTIEAYMGGSFSGPVWSCMGEKRRDGTFKLTRKQQQELDDLDGHRG